MRRAIARGRLVPQSRSTDPRMGRVSLKAAMLYDRMWINCDDQGRLSGDPDEIKYATCPNLPEISKDDIPQLLTELEKQGFLKVYTTSKAKAIQMLDWWEEQRLQWAYPSGYPPPEGWKDSLRYHPTPKEITTENWPPPGRLASELLPSELPNKPPSALPSELPNKPPSALPSKPQSEVSHTLPTEKEEEKERGRRKGRGKGNLPSALGSRAPPSPTTFQDILDKLKSCYPYAFGKEPGGRILAQLRDLASDLSAAGCPLKYIDEAFSEAVGQNKFSVSYVRAILLDWLGVVRGPP